MSDFHIDGALGLGVSARSSSRRASVLLEITAARASTPATEHDTPSSTAARLPRSIGTVVGGEGGRGSREVCAMFCGAYELWFWGAAYLLALDETVRVLYLLYRIFLATA